jgi:hypothetical protein
MLKHSGLAKCLYVAPHTGHEPFNRGMGQEMRQMGHSPPIVKSVSFLLDKVGIACERIKDTQTKPAHSNTARSSLPKLMIAVSTA